MTYDEILDKTIAEFNNRGLSIMALSEQRRHETFLMEQQIHDAIMADDRPAFTKLIMDWRNAIIKGNR